MSSIPVDIVGFSDVMSSRVCWHSNRVLWLHFADVLYCTKSVFLCDVKLYICRNSEQGWKCWVEKLGNDKNVFFCILCPWPKKVPTTLCQKSQSRRKILRVLRNKDDRCCMKESMISWSAIHYWTGLSYCFIRLFVLLCLSCDNIWQFLMLATRCSYFSNCLLNHHASLTCGTWGLSQSHKLRRDHLTG